MGRCCIGVSPDPLMDPAHVRTWAETRIWDSDRDAFVSWFESQSRYVQDQDKSEWEFFHMFKMWTRKD